MNKNKTKNKESSIKSAWLRLSVGLLSLIALISTTTAFGQPSYSKLEEVELQLDALVVLEALENSATSHSTIAACSASLDECPQAGTQECGCSDGDSCECSGIGCGSTCSCSSNSGNGRAQTVTCAWATDKKDPTRRVCKCSSQFGISSVSAPIDP